MSFGLLFARLLKLPPWIYLLLVAVSVLGVERFQHGREVRRLTGQIDEGQRTIARQETAIATLTQSHAAISQNRDRLSAELRRQTEAVAALSERAAEAEQLAALRSEVLQQQMRAHVEELRFGRGAGQVESGAEGMNAWLAERLP